MRTLPSSRSRDAAICRLARCNRWLLAGAITLTAAFTEVAAQAFPGKTRVNASSKDTGTSASRSHRRVAHAHTEAHKEVSRGKALAAPTQTPKAVSAPQAATTTTEQTTTPTETAKATETQTSTGPAAESSSTSVVSGGS
jgi:hypothetical protein